MNVSHKIVWNIRILLWATILHREIGSGWLDTESLLHTFHLLTSNTVTPFPVLGHNGPSTVFSTHYLFTASLPALTFIDTSGHYRGSSFRSPTRLWNHPGRCKLDLYYLSQQIPHYSVEKCAGITFAISPNSNNRSLKLLEIKIHHRKWGQRFKNVFLTSYFSVNSTVFVILIPFVFQAPLKG